MFIPATAGRPIPARSGPRKRERALHILTALNLLAVGGLLAMILANRLLQAQLEISGDTYLAAASAILDFMDDLLPYLAAHMGAASILTLVTLATWAFSDTVQGTLRIGIVALLVALVLFTGLWMSVGRRDDGGVPFPTTPTPTVLLP